MPESPLPNPSYASLVTRISDDSRGRTWTGNDDDAGHYHNLVDANEVPCVISLYWKSKRAGRTVHVGTYKLSLTGLARAGFAQKKPGGKVRLRFVRNGSGIVEIRPNASSPGIPVGRADFTHPMSQPREDLQKPITLAEVPDPREAQRQSPADTGSSIRSRLVNAALDWEQRFGVAPAITSALSEYDAARLVGHSDDSFSSDCVGRTAVTRGTDFTHNGIRYQVKANRPSGKRGSFVTLVAKCSNFDWDRLLWLLYDRHYVLQEAWEWDIASYRAAFEGKPRLSPADMRGGIQRYPPTVEAALENE
ncbi:MAG: hypothetical protein ACSLFE_11830 [Gemmatimonadaceae bacterium]